MPSHLLIAIRITRPRSSACPSTLRVLLADVVVRVEHQDHDMRLGDRLQRLGDAGALDRVIDPGAAPHAGGIDEQEIAPVALKRHQDAVARGAGLIAGDHALLADQAIHQRRLADVGPADDRDADGTSSSSGSVRLRIESLEHVFDQFAAALAVAAAIASGIAQPQRVKVGGDDVRLEALGSC